MVKRTSTKNTEAKNINEVDEICEQLSRQVLTPTKMDKLNIDTPSTPVGNGIKMDKLNIDTPSTPVGNSNRIGTGPSTPHRIQALNEAKLQLRDDSHPGKENQYRKKGSTRTTSKRQVKGDKLATKIAISATGSTPIKKGKATNPSIDTQITDFFPIRRSDRKSKSAVLQEKQDILEQCIRSKKADGLRIQDFGMKGRGIVATRTFKKGDFVIEYIGDLMDAATARAKEERYAHDASKGCYSYYFVHGGRQWCIDGTEESKYMGRLINHSRKIQNLVTKTIEVDGLPHLILLAKRDIKEGEEILYDYGDRSKEALEHHPWLAL